MKQLIRNFKLLSVLILAISFTSCEDDDAVLPKVIAGFTHTIDIDNPGTVRFINTSENATGHEWDFGDGSKSTLINPIKTYPNGTYTVTLKAKNGAGDSDIFEDTITINIPLAIGFPVTFDDANVNYDVAAFDGAAFQIVDNPDVSGSNDTASKVGEITNIGAEYEGITFRLGENISLATEKTIKMDFWSDTEVSVLLKLEVSQGGDFTEITVNHGGTGWEELLFNFSSSSSYPKVVIFVDGPGTTAGTFYFDNLIQEETPAPICDVETEESLNAANLNMTFLSDPGTTATQGNPTGAFFQDNVTYEYVDNPDSSTDANRSCKVAKITKSGVQPWDNLQIDFDDKFIFTDGSNITLKVYSPVSGYNVTLKLEDKTNGDLTTGDRVSTTSTTLTNAWEELTIPFGAGDSGIYDRLVIFFDLEGAANTNAYFIDDIKVNLGGGGGGGDCVAETMQSLSPATDFNLTFMSDPGTTATQGSESNKFFQDNVTYEYVDNPDFSMAENNSCKVGKITKSGVEAWDNLQIDFDEKFVFTDGSNFTIKVFSPVSGYKVTLKLEDKTNGDLTTGDRASTTSTTLTNAWEELTIPFGAGDSGIYDRLVIFFDLEGAANTNAYYIDDLKLNLGSGGGGGGGGGGDCPAPPAGELLPNGDFEANNGDGACWQFNLNGGTAEMNSAEANSGTYSARLVTGKDQAPNIKLERFAASIAAGTTVQVTFKYKFTTPLGVGSILQVLAFSEKTAGAVEHNMGNATDQPLNTWNTFTNTFVTSGDIAEGISLLLQLTGSGNDGGAGEVFIDDVQVTQL